MAMLAIWRARSDEEGAFFLGAQVLRHMGHIGGICSEVFAALLALGAPSGARADDITVFAAASLKGALDTIAADWQAQTGARAALVYGGSAALAKQIQAGAPADVYISAAANWMDVLQTEGLVAAHSRRDILGNSLVLIAHDPRAGAVSLTQGVDILSLLQGGVLAMGHWASVPAGQYGRQALESLGIWNSLAPHVAGVQNVRMALALVASGDARYGIVYASDAVADARVTVVAQFDAALHSPIIYPAAVVVRPVQTPHAGAFLDHISSPAARAIFAQHGFAPLP
jgi:molybdate transport system substrate-binding protein